MNSTINHAVNPGKRTASPLPPPPGKRFSLPSSPFTNLPSSSSPSLQGRVRAPSIIPVYETDSDGYAIGNHPSHYSLSLSSPYLKNIFGDSSIHVQKLGQGDFWSAWTIPSHPHLVIKVINPSVLKNRDIKTLEVLNGFAQFPQNPHVILAPSPGSIQKALEDFKLTGIFVQMKAEPMTAFSLSHSCFIAVRDALADMTLNTLPFIEDFRPRNTGTIDSQLVDFDPIDQRLEEEDIVHALQDYYLEWAGGTKNKENKWIEINKNILGALIKPLQEADSPTARSRQLLSLILHYLAT